ncbi:sensor histidine kinase [Thalassotalea sediminis]|uniref:sensor histidine kinase n=1 Tax=Thalassotalea sediminis TaxID=1759089 RepID=UPI0025746E03|nr:HAMP domain-containing sensor histidine kinase [Thalassotalea sediminis]
MKSLEGFLNLRLLLLALPGAIAIGLYLNTFNVNWHWYAIALFCYGIFVFSFIVTIKFQTFRAFNRASLHLDAIKQEDFNQFAKSSFPEGKVKEFHQQLSELSNSLQARKSRYDQHTFLVYRLISELASPVLVFNAKQQLSFANDAFTQLFNQPWQVYRHALPERLGLTFKSNNWLLNNANGKWQIKHSQFVDNGETHLLLVFIDIESTLRENQLKAWQQIIRVLSHEIRNSLTPVSSMAETLAEKSLVERDKQILNVITDRCQHLQSFVDRYSTISKKIELKRSDVSIDYLSNLLHKLFTNKQVNINTHLKTIWVDISFFEQVLLNLTKNAFEANATKVDINIEEVDQHILVDVIDDGHGFKNLDNLFVPLYTTKPDGQGIGLSFCRNIIEQHDGVIELHNNPKKGVTAMITLPTKPL